jgi:hypothetical protein
MIRVIWRMIAEFFWRKKIILLETEDRSQSVARLTLFRCSSPRVDLLALGYNKFLCFLSCCIHTGTMLLSYTSQNFRFRNLDSWYVLVVYSICLYQKGKLKLIPQILFCYNSNNELQTPFTAEAPSSVECKIKVRNYPLFYNNTILKRVRIKKLRNCWL